jgi:WD40 repeat protein
MTKKKTFCSALVSILLLLLAACAAVPARNPTAVTQPPSPSTIASQTPTINLTATKDWVQFQVTLQALKTQVEWVKGTATPVRSPVLTRTATPSATPISSRPIITSTLSDQAISLQNFWKIQQLTILGKGRMEGVAWSPDGEEIAVSGVLGIDIYNSKTLDQVRKFNVRGSELVFSSSGAKLAVITKAGIQILETSTGLPLLRVSTKIKYPTTIQISPNGKFLVVTGDSPGPEDYYLEVWDVNHATSLYTRRGQAVFIKAAFSPDSKVLAVNLMQGGISLLNPASGEEINHIVAYGDVSFRPDGTLVAFQDGLHIAIIDINSGQSLKTVRLDEEGYHFWLSLNGEILVVNGSIVYDLDTGQLISRLNLPEGYSQAAFNPDGTQLAGKDIDGNFKVWDLRSGKSIKSLEYANGVSSLVFMPEQAWNQHALYNLAVAAEKKVYIWDTSTGTLLQQYSGHPDTLTVASSPDGTLLVTTSSQTNVEIWNSQTGDLVKTIDYCTNQTVFSAFFSPDGKQLAVDCTNFYVFDITSWEVLFVGAGEAGWFLNDGQLVTVQGSTDTQSLVFRAAVKGKVSASPGNEYFSLPLTEEDEKYYPPIPKSFVLNDRNFAVGTMTANIYVWDLKTYRLKFKLVGHKKFSCNCDGGDQISILGMAFSPFGNLLATAGWDGTVRLWNLEDGKPLRVLTVGGSAEGVAFSQDGRYLAAGSSDGTVSVWGLP